MTERYASLLGVFVAGVAIVGLGGCGGGGSSRSTTVAVTVAHDGVVLTASASKQSLHRNEPLALSVRLANHGSSSLSVSNFAMGTLHVVSLTRDGTPVRPSHTFIQTFEDLGTVIHDDLRPLDPGGSVALDWGSQYNQGAGGQAVYSVTVERDQNALDLYSLALPGHYVLSVDYSYPAVAKAEPSTLQGATNQASVSFDVVP